MKQRRLSALGVQAVLEKPFRLEGYLKVGEFLAGFADRGAAAWLSSESGKLYSIGNSSPP
jgi:hypothetical protein